MSKLSRKAKVKQHKEEENGKKVLIYLSVGLILAAIVIGILVM